MINLKGDKELKREEFEHLKRIGKFKLKGKCSICDNEGGTCFHHIIPLSMKKGTNNPKNVIEVCYECHREIHGGLALITEPLNDKQKKVIGEANTKKIKMKYDFTDIDSTLYGELYCEGFDKLVDHINDILISVMNKGHKIRWSKTGKSQLATMGARKTINAQATYYNEKYKLCRREYDCGYIEIYVPNKRGLKKVV